MNTDWTRSLEWLDQRRWWVFAFVGLLLLAGFNGQWRVNADSALYVELGRNLAEGEGFTYHGKPHNWVEPGLPMLIGASFRLFGTDNFYPITAAILLMGVAVLVLVYRLFCLHADRPTAVLMVLLMGVSSLFYRYHFIVFTDMPALLGVVGFLYGYERYWQNKGYSGWVWVAVSTLVMIAFRPIGMIFVGAVGLATLWHLARGPDRLRHALLGLMVLGVVLTFRAVDPRLSDTAGEATFNESMAKILITEQPGFVVRRALTDFLPAITEEYVPEAMFRTGLGPGLSTAVSVAVLAAGLALFRRRPLWAIWIAVTLLQMLFWVPRARYFLPLMPLLLFGCVLGLQALPALVARYRSSWEPAARWAVAGLIGFYLGINVVYCLLFAFEQRRTPFLEAYDRGRKVEIIRWAEYLSQVVPDGAEVIADEIARELSYFGRIRAVGPLTARYVAVSERDLQRERERLSGQAVYVVLPGRRTSELMEHLKATEVRRWSGPTTRPGDPPPRSRAQIEVLVEMRVPEAVR
jgi:hypothetical protein